MFKYISKTKKKKVLTSQFRVQSANSDEKTIKDVGIDEKIQKTLNFDDVPGPKSYPVIGTLYKYLPLIGKLVQDNNKIMLF